ncbi:hypothetical protein CASFOL_024430 [Castilleja foliolosa]|uniref:RING-type E3 ubiquitin transferase n=1 Tax=Castilleja foliolosa TaxID=1961234 RepID=A0ABD3CNA7_9LAMI
MTRVVCISLDMGHRNNPFTGHIIDTQTDQQAQARSHSEPCIFYGPISNFPQPNNIHHSVVPASNHCNFNFHLPPPERRDGTMYYGAPRQHPGPNLDLAIATPSGHYNPYMAPPFAIRDIPTQTNHGGIVGGLFKGKNALEGPSSSVPSSAETDVITFVQPESAVLGRNNGHLIQGGFIAPPPVVVGLPGGNPWLDVHFGSNNCDVGAFGWTHAPIPYVHHAVDMSAGVNGATDMNSNGFMPPPFAQGHNLNPHHHHHHQLPPMQGARGYNNVNLPSSLVAAESAPSRQISSYSGINHHQFQDVVDVRPTFVAPHHVPPTGIRFYRPQQREIVFDSVDRAHTSPFLRMLPEDKWEVALLEFPGYREVIGDSMDQHRDMRLDIDHMSYEELLALEEQIGCVGTGLPEGFICNYLKIRTFSSSPTRLNLEGQTCPNQPINFCVICQTDYENKDKIGTIDCGHEYHKECIKKWLLLKNTCPVCKSTALGRKAKDL